MKKRFLLLAALLALPATAAAQDDSELAATVRAGVWLDGDHDPWPAAALSLDWRMRDRFVLDGSYAAVSRPVVLCDFPDGQEPEECDERKTIHIFSAGMRAEIGSGAVRPYLGAFGGVTQYNARGATFGPRGGVSFVANERISVLGDVALNFVGDDSLAAYCSFALGATLRL